MERLAEEESISLLPVWHTDSLGSILSKERPPLLFVFGGDGTIHHLLPFLTENSPPVLLIPTGMGNELARALGIPLRPLSSFPLWKNGTVKKVCVGRIQDIWFINSAGTGIDSSVSFLRSRWRLPLPYLGYFFLTFPFLSPFSFRIRGNGKEHEGKFLWLLISNSGKIGGGIPIIPSSNLYDEKMELLLLRAGGKWEILQSLPKALKGKHLPHRLLEIYPIQQATLFSPHPRIFNVDGEIYTFSGEIQIEAGKRWIPFIVPREK